MLGIACAEWQSDVGNYRGKGLEILFQYFYCMWFLMNTWCEVYVLLYRAMMCLRFFSPKEYSAAIAQWIACLRLNSHECHSKNLSQQWRPRGTGTRYVTAGFSI